VRTITKGAEPASLTAHRQTPHSDYDNYADKDALRRALVNEQRGLCCYCMGRIYVERSKMRIEHWQSQKKHPNEQLNYRNLLGACMGGENAAMGDEKKPRNRLHCDTRKSELDLQWNPSNPAHHIETRIKYEADGSICSDEVIFGAQLNEVLNLNFPFLKNNRRGVLDAILEWWKHEKHVRHGAVPRARFEQERDRRVDGAGQLEPYCQVAVWWLNQRLEKMSA